MDIKFKNNSKLKLPLLFTQLEYIESTGTQYIDTNIILTKNISFDLDYQKTDLSLDWFFGSATAHNGKGIFITNFGDGLFVITDNSKREYIIGAKDMDRHKIEYRSNQYVKIDNKTISIVTNDFNSVKPCLIFGSWSGGGISKVNQKVYNCIFYNGNNIIANFIPVKRYSDNVICMYDTVSETFFENSGTGDFIAGPEVSSIIYRVLDNIILKTITLYHENTPNVNGLQFLNSIFNYQRTHQDEVKEYYYPTTQLWQDIITKYPDILYWYDINHKFCTYICETNDPEQYTKNFLQVVGNYPDIANVVIEYPDLISIIIEYPSLVSVIINYPNIAPIIIENSEVVHSLVDTGYEPYLANNTNAYIDTGISMNHTYNSYFKFQPVSYIGTFNCILGARLSFSDNAYYFGYTSDSSFVELSPTNITSFTPNFNSGVHEISVVNGILTVDGVSSMLNYSQDTDRNVYLFRGNGANEPSNSKISYFKVEDNNHPILWLVPIQNSGNPCMIDLLTGTKYLNQGTGNFTYSLEPKNA